MNFIAKNILCIAFSIIYVQCFAQTSAEQFVLGSAGGESITTSGDSYMYNIGETVVFTSSSPGSINLTQGFEQPESEVSDIIIFNPPNAFSPDGDGVNDTWILPLPAQFINNVRVIIFNRWGDEVAVIEEYNNMDNVWDGTYSNSGEQVTNGTFFYIVESKNADKKYSGWIQVVR